ncbi:hypothetical protein BBJ28_00006984 [Nothophytophthora sp. Chile5]|nr:hypothetical protein BBJ28_00006984 [Nothophytophthora sp. Chile5]
MVGLSMSWSALAPLFLLVSFQLIHGCIHDSLDHKHATGHQEYDINHPFLVAERQRRLHDDGSEAFETHRELAVDTFQPIRITPYYHEASLSQLSADSRSVVVQVVEDAISRIRQALQVIPVQGNLTAQRWCTSYWSTTPRVCHAIEANETCLEMPMPDDHFASLRYCATCTTAGCTRGNCTASPAGNGVANTDFLIYVMADNTSSCDSGTTLAYASTCQQDQFDRPTFGMVNFCPAKLSSDSASYERQVATALHEFSHALGFSARFFPLMRFEDGTPRTPRDGTGKPPTYSSGTCPNGAAISYYVQPANTTVQYFTERDHVVAKMVTPRVRTFAQKHFNCSTLEGAELESQDSGCLGSHWEERLFEPEYMTAVDSFHNVFSALTLAFFEDSGWYRVNGSTAQRLHFGEQRGCAFATEKCINPATQEPLEADHFCAKDDVESCSVDATSRSVCSLSTQRQLISPEYRYFPADPTKGGVNAFADFCPLNVGFAAGDCTVPTNLQKVGSTAANMFGETYCPTCKCTPTSLRSSDSTGWTPSTRRQTGCYDMRCLLSDDAGVNGSSVVVELTVPRSATLDDVHVNCTVKGSKVTVPGFTGYLTCPDPVVVCNLAASDRFLDGYSVQSTSSYGGSSTPSSTSNTSKDASGSTSNSRSGTDSGKNSSGSKSSGSSNATGAGKVTTGTTTSSGTSSRHTAISRLVLGAVGLLLSIY